MLRKEKVFLLMLAMFLVMWISVQPVTGEEYPTRPVEIICPYTAGSTQDLLPRIFADIAPKYLGQPVVVINKPGAAASLATADVITSKPDGYKLLSNTTTFFGITVKTQNLPFDPNDLTPIASFAELKNGMVVKGDSPWKTLGDLLDYARKNPGKVRWAHPGRGISLHLSALSLFRKASAETIDLPLKGAPELLSAILGGHVDAVSITYGTTKDLIKAQKIRMLTFYSDHRYRYPPDVPCTTELGFPEAGKFAALIGLYAHKDTSEKIRKILFETFKKVYEDPEFKKRIENLGEEPRFEGAEFIKGAIKRLEEVGVPILKEMGLYKEK